MKDNGNDTNWNVAYASLESYNISNNLGALAFINSSYNTTASSAHKNNDNEEHAIKSISQIHCITLSSLDTTIDSTASTSTFTSTSENDNNDNNKDSIKLFSSLQMYTRFAFLPSIKAMEADDDDTCSETNAKKQKNIKNYKGLQEKIHDLDITLTQCQRERNSIIGHQIIPHVILNSHSIFYNYCSSNTNSRVEDIVSTIIKNENILHDDKLLNEIQSIVTTTWISSISRITILSSSTPFPTIIDHGDAQETPAEIYEISFWITLEETLKSIIEQELQKLDIKCTLEILKLAKRFLPLKALETNTNLYTSYEKVMDITSFLKNYPIQKLLEASSTNDFDSVLDAIEDIFAYLPKIRLSRYYDLQRCLLLVSATTLSIRNKMIYILKKSSSSSTLQQNIMTMPYKDYIKYIHGPTIEIFNTLSERLQKFQLFIFELCRKRTSTNAESSNTSTTTNDEKSMNKIWKNTIFYHEILKERLNEIYTIRNQLDNLYLVISDVVSKQQQQQSTTNTEKMYTIDDNDIGIISISLVTNITKRIFSSNTNNSSANNLSILFNLSKENNNNVQQIFNKIRTLTSKLENTLAKTLRQHSNQVDKCHPLLSRPLGYH